VGDFLFFRIFIIKKGEEIMKKILAGLFAILLVFGVVGMANATLYTDVNCEGYSFNDNNKSHTWTFDLDNDNLLLGDINPGDTINSALLNVLFWDDEFDFIQKEFGNVITDGSVVWSDVELDILDSFCSIDVLAYVVNDHQLNLTIQRNRGDFKVIGAEISGCYTTPVPEPATMILVGAGLIALAGFGRKRFITKA